MPRTTEQGHRAPCRHHQLGEQQRKAHSTENESDHIATRHRRSDEKIAPPLSFMSRGAEKKVAKKPTVPLLLLLIMIKTAEYFEINDL